MSKTVKKTPIKKRIYKGFKYAIYATLFFGFLDVVILLETGTEKWESIFYEGLPGIPLTIIFAFYVGFLFDDERIRNIKKVAKNPTKYPSFSSDYLSERRNSPLYKHLYGNIHNRR